MEEILSDTIKLDKKGTGVLMIAHRGLSGLETENTECAFVAAGNRSYYGIETDVHFTKDGKYVISHDGNLSRIFGKDIEIKDYLYEDLRKVRKTECGDTVEYTVVPSLEEYFGVCRRYGKKSVLELKVEYSAGQLREIIQIIIPGNIQEIIPGKGRAWQIDHPQETQNLLEAQAQQEPQDLLHLPNLAGSQVPSRR